MSDTDNKHIKRLKMLYRKYSYKMQYIGNQPKSIGGGTEYLRNLINGNRPFMVCRIGAEESRTVNRWMKHKEYTPRNIHNIMYNAGVYPNDVKSIDKFCEIYSSSLESSDAIFTWGCVGESALIRRFCPKDVVLLQYAMNNFIFYDDVWTTSLERKKVLVVHPFVKTIEKQYAKREILFEKPKLPTFKKLELVQAIQSNAGEGRSSGYDSWFDALEHMKREVDEKDYEIALIAAGAYGIPLAAYIKKQGKQSIHIGSNLQILFGIRGKRWDGWTEWTPYFNENWVYPSDDETPKGKNIVEGGSYWK